MPGKLLQILFAAAIIALNTSCVAEQHTACHVADNNKGPKGSSGGRQRGSSADYSAADFRNIAAMTARMLDSHHYSAVRMSPELSARIFDRYFDELDPLHMFFTLQDIQRFSSYRNTIGSKLQNGEYDFAFEVYDLYRQRYAQYRRFTQEMFDSEIDFTVDEEIAVDLSKQPRPENEAAMKELWRKHVKNELLSLRLSARLEQEERANNPDASAGESSSTPVRDPKSRILQRQRDVGNSIDKRERIDILGILLDCMAQSYGAHSNYQAPKSSDDMDIHMSLSLTGIGATLTSEDGYIKIVELVPGGPAELSGKIKVGDRIISVTQEDGEVTDLIDMPVSQAVQYIRGEKGTRVTLEILSGNASTPIKVTIVRDRINLQAGAAKGEIREVNGVRVGIITLPSFYMDFEAAMRGDQNARKASTDVLRILEEFRTKDVQSILIDLRSNGGGSLPDAITLTGLFLNGGPVVQIRTKDGMEVENDPSGEIAYDGPLVLLTSKMSASATEIFTGALADAKRAVVVGDSRTFGKGTVLRVESLDRYRSWFRSGSQLPAGALTFEIAMFFRPAGSSVQQLGIIPDIILPSLTEEMRAGEIYLDNHLPWDQIPGVRLNIFDRNLDRKIAQLREQSAARIAENAAYQAFIRQIALYRTIRDRRTITLNEEARYEIYRREREIAREAERLLSDESGESQTGDVVLLEALNIAADLGKMPIDRPASQPQQKRRK